MIEPEPLQQMDRTYVRLGRRKLSCFSGCDYFRLSSHPAVVAAVQAGAQRWGLNVAALRLTTGNHILYQRLERRLAGFFDAEGVLLTPTGYIANLIAAQALAGDFSHALLDGASHASLSDAARFLGCPVLQFKHGDAAGLERLVRRCGRGARLLLLTDGMFARDGTAAPLADYLAVLPGNARLLVDDAHAAGVLGATGKGTIEHAGLRREGRFIQTITLSKAFGAYGGAILGTAALRRRILKRSALFVGSTPVPLPMANAALESIRLLAADPGMRRRLIQNQACVKLRLRQAGWALPAAPGPIVRYVPKNRHEAAALKDALLAAGIYPPLVQYPGGPRDSYFRFVISSEHSQSQARWAGSHIDGVPGRPLTPALSPSKGERERRRVATQ